MTIAAGTRLGFLRNHRHHWCGRDGRGVSRPRHQTRTRIVAIKVLPTHLADSPKLRERFEREARTIASLNHPHTSTLYDVGHQDGIDYLVMEYLEGETLEHRLLEGRLTLGKAYSITCAVL